MLFCTAAFVMNRWDGMGIQPVVAPEKGACSQKSDQRQSSSRRLFLQEVFVKRWKKPFIEDRCGRYLASKTVPFPAYCTPL